MLDKTKAAMPGRQCSTENKEQKQDTRTAAGGQRMSQRNFAPSDFIQFCTLGTAPLAQLARPSQSPEISGNTISKPVGYVIRVGCTALQHTPYLSRCRGCEPVAHTLLLHTSFRVAQLQLGTSPQNWENPDVGYQLFGSIPRCCNSLRIILLIQAASDSSPSCCWACSINSRNSGSSLNWNGGLPRLSFLCVDTSITPDVMCLCVMTHYIHVLQIATPRSAGTLPRRLTKPLYEVTTMAELQSTQTRPEFTWLFLATPKHYPECAPVVLRFDADTETNARAAFPGWELVFAAKIRAQAPCRVSFFDYSTRRGWEFDSAASQEVRHA